ncbi:MAG: hypothetical protein LBU66_01430, partial [Treponema sp.]|nr:hypothetical protein [Treponema sp.]
MNMKQKNKLIGIIAVLVAVILSLSMTACEEPDDGKTHACEFTGWKITTEATCKDLAIQTGTCSCGKTSTRSEPNGVINPALHIWGAWDTSGEGGKKATCAEEGKGTRTCTNTGCEAIDPVTTIPKLSLTGEHSYPAWGIPTCIQAANSDRTCTTPTCGTVETRDDGFERDYDNHVDCVYMITGSAPSSFTAEWSNCGEPVGET